MRDSTGVPDRGRGQKGELDLIEPGGGELGRDVRNEVGMGWRENLVRVGSRVG